MNQKRKGNTFENAISKSLSKWLFDDEHMLSRHPSSGAKKCAWRGDIVPQKQLPPEWVRFPFYIETKTGYKKHIPTFYNYSIITKWLDSCINNVNDDQNIIMLVCRFKNKKILLISDYKFKDDFILLFNHRGKIFYVFLFEEILKLDREIVRLGVLEVEPKTN